MRFQKVVLSGYMGAGKSVAGKALAEITGLEFIELDAEIEAEKEKSVTEIFASEGEIAFRKAEHNILKSILAKPQSFILGLGGGTPCYAGNHVLIEAPGVKSFYLKASVETLTARLLPERSARPLITGITSDKLPKFIAQHLFERSFYYTKANFTVFVDGKSPEAIASEIAKKLS